MKKVNSLVAAVFAAILVLTGCSNYDAAEHEAQLNELHETPTPSATQEPVETAAPEPTVKDKASDVANGIKDSVSDIDFSEAQNWLEGFVDNTATPTEEETDFVAYDRSAFPLWEDMNGNGCDARQETLARDMNNVVLADNGCTVESGDFYDPAAGEHVDFVNDGQGGGVDIDHTVSLSYAAQHGNAMNWTQEQRKQFANDPINLKAMEANTNRSKSDDGPSDWMPADTEYHCTFAKDFTAVSKKYEIQLPAEDAEVLANAC